MCSSFPPLIFFFSLHCSFQNGAEPKRGLDRLYVMLCSLHVAASTVRSCSCAEAANLTMLSTCYISHLPSCTTSTVPFSLGPKKRLAVDVLNRVGCCMCWWWLLRTLCCGLFLSWRLLWNWSSRWWLSLKIVFSLFCAVFFCVLWNLADMHAVFVTGWWLTFILILVGIFMRGKNKKKRCSK